MGGVEDDEPPLKRVKVSSTELNSLSNNSSHTELVGLHKGLMARPLPFHGKEETIGSKGVIKRLEFVRIITEALYSLGYERSGALLEEESGIVLHKPAVNLLRKQLLDGCWDESIITLHKIGGVDANILKSASFLIMEQKFFEFLDSDRVLDALKTLRREISPLCINKTQVHKLAACIVFPSQPTILSVGWSTECVKSRLKLLEKLQKLLPPTIMMPERRLEQLLEQALNIQRQACSFHNALDGSLSLYSDHQCGRDHIPSQSVQVLEAHMNEVWFLQFSNNGKYLASSSRDKSTIIWEIQGDGEVTIKHTLTDHCEPVLMVAWSPDDHMLLTCGLKEVVKCWDVHSGNCIHVYKKSGVGLISCGWFPDGKSIITGLSDRSICMWGLDGKELECWKGQRTVMISDLAVTADSKWIITNCKETTILLFDREAKVERMIEVEHTITSFSLSRDNNFLLLNLINQEIHLWQIKDDLKLIAKYKGHKRSRFLIRSCFGGIEQAFVASGSEDSQVYIWLRSTGELIAVLPGHSGSVNCVSWNPTNPHMLASGSDDHTIRIWGLNDTRLKCNGVMSNGVVHCNGNSK